MTTRKFRLYDDFLNVFIVDGSKVRDTLTIGYNTAKYNESQLVLSDSNGKNIFVCEKYLVLDCRTT